MPTRTPPTNTTIFGPKRSTSQPSTGTSQVSVSTKIVKATWIAARPQWYFWSIGLTNKVQPYCRLAIITMQMMPKISCPQRVASEAMGRASAAPDVVAISVPLAFMVTAGLARVAYNILRMGRLPSSRARSSQAGARSLGRAGLPGDGLGEGKPRKNFVEIAAEMCRQGHPKGTNAPGKVALVSGAGPRQIVSSPDLVDRRGCRNDRMSAPAYRHGVRSRTQPRASGSADTAD